MPNQPNTAINVTTVKSQLSLSYQPSKVTSNNIIMVKHGKSNNFCQTRIHTTINVTTVKPVNCESNVFCQTNTPLMLQW